MKWAMDFMFYYDHRVTSEHWPNDDPVHSAQSPIILMVSMFSAAAIFGIWRFTGFDAIGWFAQFWPESHPTGKGMRALDGLPILLMVVTLIWTYMHYSRKRSNEILARFQSMTDQEFKELGRLSVFLRFSGLACVFFVVLKYDFANALLLAGVAWVNWKIHRRFYVSSASKI